jgi:hypothetical protein
MNKNSPLILQEGGSCDNLICWCKKPGRRGAEGDLVKEGREVHPYRVEKQLLLLLPPAQTLLVQRF